MGRCEKALWQRIPLTWRFVGPTLLLALGVIGFAQSRPDGRLHLYFLDVGPGNAILIVTPSGRRALVDGGPDPTALLTGLGNRLPFWERELSLVLLTETASDRLVGAVALLERYRPRMAGRPGRFQDGPGWRRWHALLDGQEIVPLPLQRGIQLDLGDGVWLEVLHPAESAPPDIVPGGPEDALVLRLRYGEFRALLPTAAGPAVQRLLQQNEPALASTLLLIPRQAEENALDERFLEAVRPALVIASVGTGYHQNPDARTLALVHQAGLSLYRTDQQGTIEVVSDGRTVWVTTER